MAITEAQLAERAATAAAIEHLKAAIELLKPLPDEGELYAFILDGLNEDLSTLDEIHSETFIDTGGE